MKSLEALGRPISSVSWWTISYIVTSWNDRSRNCTTWLQNVLQGSCSSSESHWFSLFCRSYIQFVSMPRWGFIIYTSNVISDSLFGPLLANLFTTARPERFGHPESVLHPIRYQKFHSNMPNFTSVSVPARGLPCNGPSFVNFSKNYFKQLPLGFL